MIYDIEKLKRLREGLSSFIRDVSGFERKRSNPKSKIADIDYNAAMIDRLAHEVHCRAVEAGLAGPYPDDYYGESIQKDGWHEMKFNRRRPAV